MKKANKIDNILASISIAIAIGIISFATVAMIAIIISSKISIMDREEWKTERDNVITYIEKYHDEYNDYPADLVGYTFLDDTLNDKFRYYYRDKNTYPGIRFTPSKRRVYYIHEVDGCKKTDEIKCIDENWKLFAESFLD